MEPFKRLRGIVAPLEALNVDTDQIIPKQFLKRIERSGYGEFLFYDWMKDPAFELRRPEYEGATILVAGRNFGCGSSREHAAWALEDYGFRAVLAPSYSDIFRTNAFKTGIAPIALAPEELQRIVAATAAENVLTVDLETLEISHPGGLRMPFDLDGFQRECLLHGLDEIARTLRLEGDIAAYEARTPGRFDALSLPA